jgi:hypothetical protein
MLREPWVLLYSGVLTLLRNEQLHVKESAQGRVAAICCDNDFLLLLQTSVLEGVVQLVALPVMGPVVWVVLQPAARLLLLAFRLAALSALESQWDECILWLERKHRQASSS